MPTPAEQLAEYLRSRRAAPILPTPTGLPRVAGVGMPAADPSAQLRDYLNARATGALTQMQTQAATPQNPAARFIQDLPEPIRESVGGGLRKLARTLEPLQLPQDTLFAVIAGATDPNTTIGERLRTMKLSDYLPGGAAPERPASGEEIFTLMGFDEEAAKWAGLGADLLVDPLVFGSWLRITGKLTKFDELVRLGDRVDTFVSPLGMTREVNKVARRSRYISDFQDARMERLMAVLRNPDSEVFGIKRFGERVGKVAERILPRDTMLQLRFGKELGSEMLRAEQQAVGKANRLTGDTLMMLQRARNGPVGGQSEDVVRTYLRSMEEQTAAWETRLSDLDPGIRDLVEHEVYELAQEQTGARLGFLPLFGRADDAKRLLDEDAIELVDDARAALSAPTLGQPRAIAERGLDKADVLFSARQDRAAERLNEAVERIVTEARKRAETLGMSVDALDQEAAKAAGAFHGYLRDTLLIDAKLGKATSGYDFIANGLRSRVFELTGDMDLADTVWGQVLRVGLTKGEDGIDALRAESTGISLRPLVAAAPEEVKRRLTRRMAYMDTLEAEMERIGATMPNRGRPFILGETYRKKMDELAAEAQEIVDEFRGELGALGTEFTNVTGRQFRARRAAVSEAAAAYQEAVNRARFMPQNATTKQVARITDRRLRAERKLRHAREAYDRMVQSAREVIQESADLRSGRWAELDGVMARARTLEAKLKASDARRDFELQEVLNARKAAREAADSASDAARAAETGADEGLTGIALEGKNTIAEDILAARMRTKKYATAEAAAREPITFDELLDGMADMQALPIGEYLQGLMDGHLRRAYGVFSDQDGFNRFIDAIRGGAIVTSRMLDEANLETALAGFEREAKLIQDYHSALRSAGRGVVIRRSALVEYLEASGVSPQRINGTMRALTEATGKSNPAWQEVMRILDERVPDYQRALREMRQRGTPSQPFVANTRLFEERLAVPQNVLQALGEYSMASMSIAESAVQARRVVKRQEYFQQILALGKKHGLIRDAAEGEYHIDKYGTRFVRFADNEKIMGGFGGKLIHPQLAEELRRAAQIEPQFFSNAFRRVRALITGGYLASPSVIAANFVGGLYQAATVGMNPATTMRRLAETFQDLNGYAYGRRSELVEAMRKHHPFEVSSMTATELGDMVRQLGLREYDLAREGVAKFADDFATMWERFLQRPGVGNLRTRWAGLEGFQFVENWFKVAAFKEIRESELAKIAKLGRRVTEADRIRIDRIAAEYARTVVFDYSTLPSSLDFMKRTGLVMFPGFAYFMGARTLGAVLERPGTVAVADRISEAVANAALGIDEQILAYMGADQWMHDEQAVPFPMTERTLEDGSTVVSLLPIAQLVPTTTIWDGMFGGGWGSNPWANSITSLGMWGPLFDVLRALMSGDGESTLNAAYGHTVFDPGALPQERFAQTFRFLYNTMAPSILRRGLSADYDGRLQGLVPALATGFREIAFGPVPDDLLRGAYSIYERRSGKPDDTWREEVLKSFIRSPQVIALDGPIAGIKRQLENERNRMTQELSGLRKRYENARAVGNTATANEIAERIKARQEEYNEKWYEWTQFYQAYQARRRSQGQ